MKVHHIKLTFSSFCRNCYIVLNRKCGLSVEDYIVHFQTMYDKIVHVKDCSYTSLTEIHNHFLCNLHVTDKPLAELLEVILCLKVDVLNWKSKISIFQFI